MVRSLLKRALINLYCRGALPMRAVTWLFKRIDLRAA
jgi:hypothetical protein